MKDCKTSKITFVVVLAAVVAALTTVVVMVLRARAKKRLAADSYGDCFDYDLGDCCCEECGCGDDGCCDADCNGDEKEPELE